MTTSNSVTKKLIEVALPLEAINRGCEEDKNRKTGHIRNLHKWFAPMPLAAWRAMLFATIVDDPGEHADPAERARLFDIIERLSAFDAYKDKQLIKEARAEIQKALGDQPATIVDPFCGGGSTLLEAQRLGLATQASDLNPIPVLITTAICRIPPLFGNAAPINPESGHEPVGGWGELSGLKSDIRFYAHRVREQAWKRLAKHYPPVDGAVPFAYRWAWSVASPDPSARGAYTPLVSDWWLSKHKSNGAWIEPIVQVGEVRFEIKSTGAPPKGNTGRSGAKCLLSNDSPIPLEYIRSEGRKRHLRQTLIGIASRHGSATVYSSGNGRQLSAAQAIEDLHVNGIQMPDAALGFRVQQYGITNFLDLFTKRQAISLQTFAEEVAAIREEIVADARNAGMPDDQLGLESGDTGAHAYADAILCVLGLCVGKMAQSNNILVRWFIDPRNGSGKATPAFDRHAIPMVWDFVETNPFGGSVGDWTGPVLETALKILQLDARKVGARLPPGAIIATDPPYYANIGYADLSDFFYQWIRPALRGVFPTFLGTMSTPKDAELIAAPFRHGGSTEKANEYFRNGFGSVFHSLSENCDQRFPQLIVYAIKQSDEAEDSTKSTGWEVFLGGLIDAGLSIVATWPVRTTTDTRMIGIGTNALASAIYVICRKRKIEATKIGRAQFLRELREKLPNAYARFRDVNIAPVDLAQAAIGPGIEVYSQYEAVLETDGSAMTVGTALGLTNQVLDEVLVNQEVDFDADTRWALAWFEQFGFVEGDFGTAETLSKAKNISVSTLVHAGFLTSKAGKVRLLRPAELEGVGESLSDRRLTAWEAVHRLIKALESDGEGAAGKLVTTLGTTAEIARELAYRLYTLCERKKRSPEALSYNGLVLSWPEITRLAREGARASEPAQPDMFGRA
jgi:putative DNA methylase